MAPFRNTFSRPDSSGWNPAPSSRSADIFPVVVTDPLSGRRILARHLSIVDLPEPFSPMRPVVEPSSTSKLTSSSAQNTSTLARPPRMTAAFDRGVALTVEAVLLGDVVHDHDRLAQG